MIKYYGEMEQNSPEWYAARCGVLTASELIKILTPKTLNIAKNDKARQHVWEIAAQRITNYVEPTFESFDMKRGKEDELLARRLYSSEYAKVEQCGFVINDNHGFTLGYSPDGLVGDKGLIEIKSRLQKYQVQTLVEHARKDALIPPEHMLQVQAALLVTEREWCDYVSYCAGLPMISINVYPDEQIQAAIKAAAESFEEQVAKAQKDWTAAVESGDYSLLATERPHG